MHDIRHSGFAARRLAPKGAGRRGVTLLEVIFTLGIFTASLCWALQSIMGTVASNRVAMAAMAANAVIRSRAEEVRGIATETSAAYGNFAQGLVNYYGCKIAAPNSTAGDDALPLGPNGAAVPRVRLLSEGVLIYTFPVPAPGESLRVVGGTGRGRESVHRRGVGRVVIYIDEAAVPGDLRNNPTTDVPLWNDDWDSWNNDNERRAPLKAFYDEGDLAHPEALGLSRVFVDIVVTYFADDEHQREFFSTQRRLLVPGASGGAGGTEGGGAPSEAAGVLFGAVNETPDFGTRSG